MYKKQMYLALFGVAVLASPMLIPLIPQITAYASSERLKALQGLERAKIEERAKTSDALLDAGVLPTTRNLRITNYFDNAFSNPRPDTTLYQDDEMINVFDASGRCIGRITEGQWKWRHKVKDVCNQVQNIKPVRRK